MTSTMIVEVDDALDHDLQYFDPDRIEGSLFEEFLVARARARGPIACISRDTLLMNAAGARLVCDDDRHELWRWARRALDVGDRSVHALSLGDVQLRARCDPMIAGTTVIGALIRIGDRTSANAPRVASGWESLRESELGIAQLVAAGLTNREIGSRLFLSRHTVDFHLRQIFRKLAITSRVALARLVVERAQRDSAA